MLSSLEPRPPGDRDRGGEKEETVILKWSILVYIPYYISDCHSSEENPSVSMVTGTPPCTSCCSGEEAPACRRGKGEEASLGVRISRTDVLCNMCFLYGNHTVTTNTYLGTKADLAGNSLAVGMQFKEMATIHCVFVFIGLTLEPGGAVRPRNAYTALSSLA